MLSRRPPQDPRRQWVNNFIQMYKTITLRDGVPLVSDAVRNALRNARPVKRGGTGTLLVTRMFAYNNSDPVAIKHVPITEKIMTANPLMIIGEMLAVNRLQCDATPCSRSIVRIFDILLDAEQYAFTYIMELLPGTPISRDTPEPFRTHALMRLAEGLFCMHRYGVAHRDVKYDNTMVDPQTNTVKWVDTGMACTSLACWTPGYMGTAGYHAPEIMLNILGETHAQRRAHDVYAFGLMLLYVLVGRVFPQYQAAVDAFNNDKQSARAPATYLANATYENIEHIIKDKVPDSRFREMIATCLIGDPPTRLQAWEDLFAPDGTIKYRSR